MPFYTADLVSSMVHLPSLTCPSGCLCHRSHACHRIGTGRKDADGAIMELELLHQQAVADEEECAEINERMAVSYTHLTLPTKA